MLRTVRFQSRGLILTWERSYRPNVNNKTIHTFSIFFLSKDEQLPNSLWVYDYKPLFVVNYKLIIKNNHLNSSPCLQSFASSNGHFGYIMATKSNDFIDKVYYLCPLSLLKIVVMVKITFLSPELNLILIYCRKIRIS